jgi:hypothetical protein
MPRPLAVAADGNVRVYWVATLTLTGPTVAQLNAGTDLSYYLTPDGFNPSADEQEITDDRLADTQTYENRGRHRFSLGQLRYVTNPASPAGVWMQTRPGRRRSSSTSTRCGSVRR